MDKKTTLQCQRKKTLYNCFSEVLRLADPRSRAYYTADKIATILDTYDGHRLHDWNKSKSIELVSLWASRDFGSSGPDFYVIKAMKLWSERHPEFDILAIEQ